MTFQISLVSALFLYLSASPATAQVRIYNPQRSAERSVENRANRRVDQSVNRGLDKVEEGIGNLFRKKKKKAPKNQRPADDTYDDQQNDDRNDDQRDNRAGKSNEANNGNGASVGGSGSNGRGADAGKPEPASLKAYRKFDFVPGEKVMAFDDFSTTRAGDFPLGWNTNSGAEIVTLEGRPEKWLFMSKDGFFQPEYVKDMPENFTLEFDVFTRNISSNVLEYSFYIQATDNPRKEIDNKYPKNAIRFGWQPCGNAHFKVIENGESIIENGRLSIKDFACGGDNTKPTFVKMSIWRQKTRLRVYVNEDKVLDIPRAFDMKSKFSVFKFGAAQMNFSSRAENKDEFMVANVRYAIGDPDTRSKLMTEGRFSTTGILFDVNSDKIKPESYGVLKDIANTLTENAGVRIKIIGHTDSDGDDARNLDLSKRRAASVKAALGSEFGIDTGRIDTDGKGETEPAAPNTSPEGKANNRRVEFVKL